MERVVKKNSFFCQAELEPPVAIKLSFTSFQYSLFYTLFYIVLCSDSLSPLLDSKIIKFGP